MRRVNGVVDSRADSPRFLEWRGISGGCEERHVAQIIGGDKFGVGFNFIAVDYLELYYIMRL